MKKIVSIMLVALLATSTIFAGISFSGNFKAGYKFTFGEDDMKIAPWQTGEAKLAITAKDDNGIWSVTYKGDAKGGAAGFNSDNHWSATASVNIAKLVAVMGGDMGDFGMTLSAGDNAKMSALAAYSNGALKNNGKNSVQLAMNYGSLVKFNIAGDPTDDGRSMVVSALTEPISGLKVSAAYAYKPYFETNSGKKIDAPQNHAFAATADADIAKLAGLKDFDLGLSAFDVFCFEDPEVNALGVKLYGTYDFLTATAEFFMDTMNKENTYGIKAKVDLKNVVDNLTISASVASKDVTKFADNFAVDAEATYKLAGTSVELSLKGEYAQKNKAFILTPKMALTF